MSPEPFDQLRYGRPPDDEYVVFDPDVGTRALTEDEAAGLRDAIRARSERLDREPEKGPDGLSARELVERAEELHTLRHVGTPEEAAAARDELFVLDDIAASRAHDAGPESVEQQTADFVGLMTEDRSRAVESEARARRLHLEESLPETPARDLDAAERAYIESRGLDQPGLIRTALEPDTVEAAIDDEERER
jgi:hypothetical protein